MNRTPLFLALYGVLLFIETLSVLRGQTPSLSVEQQLRSQYLITSVDAGGQVAQVGSVFAVQQMGILGLPAPTQWPCNSYKQGGRITQATLCAVNYSISRNKTRQLQVNEKVYLTAISFKLPDVALTVQASAGDATGAPFKAVVSFEFPKNSYVDLGAIQKSISEVFTITTPPTPPIKVSPVTKALPLPSTYVNSQTPGDQLQLNADNSFSLQSDGQTTRGTFALNGNIVEIKIGADTTPMAIQGSNLTDPSGQTWTRQALIAPSTPTVAPVGGNILRNEDIIKLAKVGIDDAIIIAKIGSSTCQFDTSTDVIIQLSQSGVSSAVLKAMVAAGRLPQPTTANQQLRSGGWPTSYGYFLFDGAQYQPLTPTRIAIVVGLSVQASGVGSAVDGFADESAQGFAVDMPTFLVYQQNVDTSAFHLAKLDFVRSMQAGQFNMQNTSPQFFRNVYGTDYNQIVPVNLWRPQQQEIPLRTEPIPERNGMYRLVPDRALTPGKYALFSGQSIHASGIIFATRIGAAGDTALYFEIKSINTK
jgi:hypothetical protein